MSSTLSFSAIDLNTLSKDLIPSCDGPRLYLPIKTFGLSRFPTIFTRFFRLKTSVITFCVLLGEVAVRPIKGTSGNNDPKTASCLNAGRKS